MLVGIVGKPSCGKSTFFKAATLSEVEIANYPFTTIKPNHAVGFVRIDCADKFFNVQCNPRTGYCIDHQRFVPIDLIDVAGLVPGAHKGEGMGAQFLNDLNAADALIHVIDASGSTNDKGEPVEPLSYDPLNDVQFLEDELDFWFVDVIKRGWDRFAKQVQQTKANVQKSIAKQLSGLGVTEEMINAVFPKLGLPDNPVNYSDEDFLKLASTLRKLSKPMIIAANKADVPGTDKNIARLKEKFPDYKIIACSSESELALKEAHKHDMIKYIPGDGEFEITNPSKLTDKQKQGLSLIRTSVLNKFDGTGVQEVLNTVVFEILKMIPIFPGGVSKLEDQHGNVLPDCFLLKEKSTALDFAYKIHTDLGNKFIRAIDVKTKRTVGKDHVLRAGDVVEIISGK
ncbi:redox-regulated ATPase YchF [Candidatus Woesearchaeota archaeon]|nr:redox-regulated ATPase YchF [Candidatus Woesearchaeota archaeon]